MTAHPHAGAPAVSGTRMVLAMGSVGLFAAIALVVTFRLTAPRIAANRAAYLEAAVSRVLTGADRFVSYVLSDHGWEAASERDEGGRVFAGFGADGRLAGLAVEASGQGYADVIRLLYGYDPACGCVVGMTVLESKETPGLGDRIEKDPVFQANFEALQARTPDGSPAPLALVPRGRKTQPWEVDGISGATISSQAVTDILRASTALLIPGIEKHGVPPADSLTTGGTQ